MKLITPLAALSFAGLLTLNCEAQVAGYVDNPTGNSLDFGAAVGPVTTYTFDSLSTGSLDSSAYAGLTFGGNINQVVFTAGPAQGNTFSSPTSSGEGVHAASNALESGTSGDSLSVSFDAPVAGAGLFVIDLFNPGGGYAPTTLSAYDASDNLIGTYSAVGDNFQENNLYFMGISSGADNISEIILSHNGGPSGDEIAVDNLEVAQGTPAPDGGSSVALLGAAIMGLGAVSRRLRRSR